MNEAEAKDMMSCLPAAPFWMVLGPDVPVYRHACRSEAEREARRLAKRHGGVFVVMEAVSATVRSEFNTVTFRPYPKDVTDQVSASIAMVEA